MTVSTSHANRTTLIITNVASESVGTIREHVDALRCLPGHVFRVDYKIAQFIDLSMFDVVILHYSIALARGGYIRPKFAEALSNYNGLTVCFIQDEYRWIDDTAKCFQNFKVDVVFSLVHPSVVRKVYSHPWCDDIRFEYTLTGFVNEELARQQVPPYEQRRLDVGYRARKLSAWYGYHAQYKWIIADRFQPEADRFGLRVDISTREEDRIYGKDWIDFLADCRAVLGTESGASVCDFSGDIQRNVEEHLIRDPDATYEDLKDLYFSAADGQIVMNVISPRCFEAAALRTLMVMYPGEYGGILKPWVHYVPLAFDHSNIDDVVDVIRNPSRAKPIIDRAYREIVQSGKWSLQNFTSDVDSVIRQELEKRGFDPLENRSKIFLYFHMSAGMVLLQARLKILSFREKLRHVFSLLKSHSRHRILVAVFHTVRAVRAIVLVGVRLFVPARYHPAVLHKLKSVYGSLRGAMRRLRKFR